MSKAAKMDALEELHALTAKVLTKALSDEASPQMLAQAIKFLKDNGIEPAKDADNAALQALSNRIAEIATSGDPDEMQDLIN